MDRNAIINMQEEIQNEYDRIDKKWLELHYKTAVALFAFSFFAECFIGWIVCQTDQLNTTVPLFILKFIAVPFLFNMACLLIDSFIIRSDRISQEIKIYTVSLSYVAICFVLFTVHIAFAAMYFIFIVPIILTTIYANYRLTVITAVSSVVCVTVSELFIRWDADKVSIMENSVRLGDFLISLFVLCALSLVCMVAIRFERQKNAASIQKEIERHQLQQKLQTDELTGINNRKALHDAIKEMEMDTVESDYIFVMIDLDNFKELNDSLGHMVGDECLVQFGKIMKEHCGDGIPFRYGGDEFCILFRGHFMEGVTAICQQLQKELEAISIDNCNRKLTASFGIAAYSEGMDAARLIVHTDQALYHAKKIKNTIHVYHVTDKVG